MEDRIAVKERYSQMSNDELLHLATQKDSLLDVGRQALEAEMRKRGMDEAAVLAYKREGYEVEEIERRQFQGVGGWLTLFILGLTVFSPLLEIFNLLKEFDQFGDQATTSNAVLAGLIFDMVFNIGIMSFGIYAGVRLLQLKPNAVRVAKRYLITFFLYTALAVALVFFENIVAPRSEQSTRDFGSQLRNIIYVLIWYSYLDKSKRVAATYLPPETIKKL